LEVGNSFCKKAKKYNPPNKQSGSISEQSVWTGSKAHKKKESKSIITKSSNRPLYHRNHWGRGNITERGKKNVQGGFTKTSKTREATFMRVTLRVKNNNEGGGKMDQTVCQEGAHLESSQ